MAAIFVIITQVLTGLLDISNQVIGILLAWTLFEVPLLFLLATFNFMVSLLEELNIKPIETDETDEIDEENEESGFDFLERKLNDPFFLEDDKQFNKLFKQLKSKTIKKIALEKRQQVLKIKSEQESLAKSTVENIIDKIDSKTGKA
jgi:hypothetical protein